ncbi:MAG: 16S rRNA (cytosine(1402)-N(4))-methyltransferase RsmH [Cycloclasticus pugetii]|jgi:16S rRNA (cytosine1402-N4)-methyltransferase|uniref:16S rRNA (cytosine(1402)-N(4))-methyltransferase RsmH n=1 Tax=Cycloclasticus pugetii TaxID=34068 RepID=UPI00240A11F0|nr:16S rRNA (cytosine(1402)-N(4))-methyltransferase RsmH [Cycloclasticus pugetii]MDF1829902.1 16S rRNA (cytosine(1402)-N(4))-methyltransferase RsmH [Cycloclasticus pugetii]
MSTGELHKPVLLDEAIEGLIRQTDGVYIDGTFGRGGHSGSILQVLSPQGRLLAIDKDMDAVNSPQAQALLKDERFELAHSSFAQMEQLAQERHWDGAVDGILLDLGVSSPQLDVAERGFSFMKDGPLDMRMDSTQGESAAQWLSHVEEGELVKVLRVYGEEKFARKIAAEIVLQRKEMAIETTAQLAALIANVVKRREPGKHPATRSFQAIRIKINKELDDLEQALASSLSMLKQGGRLAVISFHSLEDRIVKRFIREQSRGEIVPRHLPMPLDAKKSVLKVVGKAIKASANEVAGNVRSRSAVLRIAEKL